MFVSFLRMTHVHVKETFCCRLLLHPDVAVGCSECAVMYTACSESVFFFFSVILNATLAAISSA